MVFIARKNFFVEPYEKFNEAILNLEEIKSNIKNLVDKNVETHEIV